MGPKKAPSKGDDGDPEDISCEQLMKFYKKNCQTYGIEVNKQIKQAFEAEFVENAQPIKKVSPLCLS